LVVSLLEHDFSGGGAANAAGIATAPVIASSATATPTLRRTNIAEPLGVKN
jgi:hypothetical protein